MQLHEVIITVSTLILHLDSYKKIAYANSCTVEYDLGTAEGTIVPSEDCPKIKTWAIYDDNNACCSKYTDKLIDYLCNYAEFGNISDECDESKNRHKRVVNGYKTNTKHYFKFVISIGYMDFNGTHEIYTHVCGGHLTTLKHMSTAAHCVYKMMDYKIPKDKWRVVVGTDSTTNISADAQIMKVIKYTRHPRFKMGRIANDSSIIEFDRTVQFSHNIKLAFICPQNYAEPDTHVYIAGYGYDEGGKPSEDILYQEAIIMDPKDCWDMLTKDAKTAVRKGFYPKLIMQAEDIQKYDNHTFSCLIQANLRSSINFY